ncbi:two-component sensor histidine kinase [Litoreibacter ponti]|uniref:histidine kinase n=1 Tax=Litoreibacter ponti TaxID=1510457 RepID=A0A2T6BJ97_9RHOB|nr:sensor histidine kinase [Litoreibacter ponti]PTX56138.1 two-component sensor histidine kinase [Litoreibacter ponti]
MNGEDRASWRESLIAKVVLYLSLALLPIGFIAIFQTRELTRESDLRSELALLALTEKATSAERQLVDRAFGAAQMLAATADVIASNPSVCAQFFENFLQANPTYNFVGLLSVDGRMSCTSDGQAYDLTNSSNFRALVETGEAKVDTNQVGRVGDRSVISVNQPYFRDEILAGFVTIAIPHEQIDRLAHSEERVRDVRYMTFNAQGEVLTSTESLLLTAPSLPSETDLTTFIGQDAQVFATESHDGQGRKFAMVPIVPERMYALSFWNPESELVPSDGTSISAILFPFFMWIASVFVASFALNRLVVQHVQNLRVKMRRFALNRRFTEDTDEGAMPVEFADMQSDFEAMARSLIRDEAELQDALHNNQSLLKEKDVLLKEVHHRVKNNLQMISSIMNMQIRQTENQETESALRRLQERVMTLATIHRNLYQTENFDAVNAGPILRELIRQMLVMTRSGHVNARTEIADLELFPDQAMSLSLLVSEAVNVALKSMKANEEQDASLDLSLEVEDGLVLLRIEHEVGETMAPHELASQLMEAFASQLEADLRTETDGARHRLIATFKKSNISPQLTDH